ncbi:sensor histidine kinase [uncultured Robinsoniella sp.]|uniref:sensor histidine kinase n=1 Tax=uncultured Robinsoniella sp. TaxID=904190 RepID=UPI00374ED0EB
MSIVLLSIVCAVLAVGFLIILVKYVSQSRQLRKITGEISGFLENGSSDTLLALSDEKEIQELLVQVNELLDHQNALEMERKNQEDSNRRMLANISHDLKTPLTVILGYSEMIRNQEGISLESIQQKVEKIYRKTTDVLEMINVFFDLVKIESGELALEVQTLDLCEVARNEILNYYDMLQEGGFQVEIDIPEEEIPVDADKQAVKRILANLIQNAIKYGADGRYLRLGISRGEDNVMVQVEDRGKGIIEDSQDKIFERLVTLEDSRNKKYQGSGLGLTITKRLAEAMGGSIKVKSSPFAKTVFTVTLPIAGDGK